MKKRIPEIIGGLLILLFAYTAVSKLITLHTFESVLRMAPVVGGYAHTLAILIPVAELIIVGLLQVEHMRGTGLIASAILLTGFTVYLVFMVLTDTDLPCSCGGAIQQLGWKAHIVFNAAFITLAIAGIVTEKKNKTRRAF